MVSSVFCIYREQIQLPVSKFYSRLRTASKELKVKMAGKNKVRKRVFVSVEGFVP